MEQLQNSDDTRQHPAFTGMFSVEQHFVCLVCSRPTCFKTDAALVVHLREHISENKMKVEIPSEESSIKQPAQTLTDSAENNKGSTVKSSESYANTEQVYDDSKGINNGVPTPIELCLFDPKDDDNNDTNNDRIHSADIRNVTANNLVSNPILSENSNISNSFSENKIIPTITIKDIQAKDFQADLEENAEIGDVNLNSCNQNMPSNQIDNALHVSMIAQHSLNEPNIMMDSNSDFTTDSDDFSTDSDATPGDAEDYSESPDLSTKDDDKITKSLVDRILQKGISSDTNPRVISDYVCTHCHSHFKNYLDLMLHLKVHQPVKTINRIGIATPATIKEDSNDVSISETLMNNDHVCNTGIVYSCVPASQLINMRPQIADLSKRGKTAKVGKPRKGRNNKTGNLLSEAKQPCVCESCGKVFSKKKDCSSHFKRVHCSKSHECDKCDRTFTFPRELREHMNIHTGTREFLCHLCPKSFLARQNLRKHLLIHTGERPHHCTKCSYRATTKDNLVKHMWSHSTETHATCTICNKNFKRLSSLRYHMTIHTGERLHKCDVCNKEFQFPIHLTKHKRSKHSSAGSGVSKPFNCTVCCKSYASRYGLKVHEQSHIGKTYMYTCPVCSVKCGSHYELKRHTLRVHTQIKPFVCTVSVCKRSFLYGAQVSSHMLRHAIKDARPCFLCKQYFSEKALSNHMLTHEKQHQCTECAEGFYTQTDLTEHLKTHFGDKPHICHVCKQRFNIVAQLLIHMRQHAD